jgi:hypothetical protein
VTALEPGFFVVQALSGLASASSLFVIASGLTLVFGVTRIVNFAHGSFYMLGAYMAVTIVPWLLEIERSPWLFFAGVLASAVVVGLLGVAMAGAVEAAAPAAGEADRDGPLAAELMTLYMRFLDAQNADLMDAIGTLEDAITKIDLETRDLLASTFNQVNEHFGRMFPTLFGGGNARLVMTGTEILDAGVQVLAQPPGKKNSTIHLLSGGEKALTAEAVLRASKPVGALFQWWARPASRPARTHPGRLAPAGRQGCRPAPAGFGGLSGPAVSHSGVLTSV